MAGYYVMGGSIAPTPVPWQFGVFACLDDPVLCCDACLCPCCQLGRQFEAATENEQDTLNYFVCVSSSVINVLATCVNAYIRYRIVEKYLLAESAGQTFAIAVFCPVCSLVQTHRELDARGVYPGGSMCVPRTSLVSPPSVVYSTPMGRKAATSYGTL
jgi:Cys-rich protein (TIGR01571 family)